MDRNAGDGKAEASVAMDESTLTFLRNVFFTCRSPISEDRRNKNASHDYARYHSN